MDKVEIAIAGDYFMLPEFFETALGDTVGAEQLELRTLQLQWPDEPMVFGPEGAKYTEYFGEPERIADFVGAARIFVNHLAPITEAMLARLPDLELVAVSRGGPVNLDMEALRARGVKVVNTPGRNANAVAEFTIGMILAETRCIRVGHEDLRRGNWRGDLYRADRTGQELCELTVGLLGYGKIGYLLARLLRPFGCRLLVADPFVTVDDDWLEQVEQDELLRQADIVTVNARVTPQTVGLVGARQLELMKSTALLINVARGPLLDYDALEQALASGGIAAAALDTFPHEPPPASWRLLQMDNVTITPHIAGASRTTCKNAAASIAEEVRRHLAGEQPLNPC